MAIVKFKETVKNDALASILGALDGGSGAGTVKFYTGTMPTTPETAISTQTLLGTVTLGDPCATISAGVMTFTATTPDSSADTSGTATWCRFENSNGVAVLDCDVTGTAGTGAVKLNTTAIVVGGPISITSMTIRVP